MCLYVLIHGFISHNSIDIDPIFHRLRQDLITHAVCPMADKDTSVEVFRRAAFAHRLTEVTYPTCTASLLLT